jgi:hypothetical protein
MAGGMGLSKLWFGGSWLTPANCIQPSGGAPEDGGTELDHNQQTNIQPLIDEEQASASRSDRQAPDGEPMAELPPRP